METKPVLPPLPEISSLRSDPELVSAKTKAAKIFAKAQSVKIESLHDMNSAGKGLLTVNELIKVVEDKRQEITKPLNDYIRGVNKAFKDVTVALESADEVLREKISNFWTQVHKDRWELVDEMEEELIKARAQGDVSKVNDLIEKIKSLQEELEEVKSPFVYFKTKYEWEVEDASKVPDDFKTVDHKKVEDAIKNGFRKIPGIRISRKFVPVLKPDASKTRDRLGLQNQRREP